MRTLAWSYIRLSTPDQIAGHGETRQEDAAQAYAEAHGLDLQPTLRDLGVSGFRGTNRKKGVLAAFLAAVRSGEVPKGSYFLVENCDRLSREDPAQAVHIFTDVILNGINVVTTDNSTLYSREVIAREPMKLVFWVLEAIRGNGESKRKGEMVAKSWQSRKERIRSGEKLSGRAPRWLIWNSVTRDWDRREDRIEVIIRILQEFDAGYGGLEIARRLNADGIPAFQNGDGWHAAMVVRLAQNRALIGEYQPVKVLEDDTRVPDGDPIPNRYPVVVDPALFYRVQEKIAGRSKGGQRGGGNHGKHFSNLFSGLARCQSCGGTMAYIGKQGRSLPFLKCANAQRGHRCKHDQRFIYSTVEEAILRHVCELDLSREPDPAEVELSLLRGQRDDVARQQERLIDQMVTGVPALQKRLSALQERLDTLDERIKVLARVEVRTPLESHRERVEALWAELGRLEGPELYAARARLHGALRTIVDRIDFSPAFGVAVTILNGLKVHYLTAGGGWYGATDWSAQVRKGTMPRGMFTDGDPKREHELDRVMSPEGAKPTFDFQATPDSPQMVFLPPSASAARRWSRAVNRPKTA